MLSPRPGRQAGQGLTHAKGQQHIRDRRAGHLPPRRESPQRARSFSLCDDVEVPNYQVDADKRADEIGRFEKALLVTRQQIAKIQSEVEKNLGKDEALIFDAHLLVLEDQALISETIREFETTSSNIETCFNLVAQRYIQAFSEIDDEYLRERAGDIRDVAQRVHAKTCSARPATA